ncbi:MAG: GTPase HflX [Planctomycetota bacterium]
MKIHGRTLGLKKSQTRAVLRLYHRRVPAEEPVSVRLARELASLSSEIGRRLGVLVDRRGRIRRVALGAADRIELPPLERESEVDSRLAGLRWITTRIDGGIDGILRAEISRLIRHRLDMILQLDVEDEEPARIWRAHILPPNPENRLVEVGEPFRPHELPADFPELMKALEDELERKAPVSRSVRERERAVLAVIGPDGLALETAQAELLELAKTSGAQVVGVVSQRRERPDGRTVLGRGKLEQLGLSVLRARADLVIFDSELSPSQVRNLGDAIDCKLIDRTQLILDIFAQRAATHDGKLAVELARWKYLMPRLVGGGKVLSRLGGGIGGNRGLGETKLELDRRRISDRIRHLESRMERSVVQRNTLRAKRRRSEVPVVALVGYTNAGKSTLFNQLTGSSREARSQMFSTLELAKRRLELTGSRVAVVTDTVGFIRDLPPNLQSVFRATLEELHEADLLVHVADLSRPGVARQIDTVRALLTETDLEGVPRLLVLNKADRFEDPSEAVPLAIALDGMPISALDPGDVRGVLDEIEARLFGDQRPRGND